MENFTHPNAVVNALLNHRSTPAGLLQEPAPSENDLNTILQCGLSAPDHAAVQPWKFLIIDGEARHRLGEVFIEAKQQDEPNFPEEKAQLLRAKPLRAPLIIAVVADVTEGHVKAPRVEQMLSAGVAAQHMQIATRALGFGSVWLTGPMARHALVKKALGLKEADELVGFLYLGTPAKEAPARPRSAPDQFTSHWSGQ